MVLADDKTHEYRIKATAELTDSLFRRGAIELTDLIQRIDFVGDVASLRTIYGSRTKLAIVGDRNR